MPNEEHLKILKQGVATWNQWRHENSSLDLDVRGADLRGAQLRDVNFREVDLEGANLEEANCYGGDFWNANLNHAIITRADLNLAHLGKARFQHADLSGSSLIDADLVGTDLSYANLTGANFSEADLASAKLCHANLTDTRLFSASLMDADLSGAKLTRTNLTVTNLLRTDFRGAALSGCYVHGASVWKVKVDGDTSQKDLRITDFSEPNITTDDLEVAQFIYLLLNHEKLRNAIDSITKKGVLLLGRFGGGGLGVLQALAAKLRCLSYLPIIFDFDRPESRNITETVQTLVGISRFVVVDLSGPSVPQELHATVPHYKIPFVPIIESGKQAYAMAKDILEYPWVIKPIVEFGSINELTDLAQVRIVKPAEEKVQARLADLQNLHL